MNKVYCLHCSLRNNARLARQCELVPRVHGLRLAIKLKVKGHAEVVVVWWLSGGSMLNARSI